MRLTLIAYTPNAEVIIAAAMLTTTSSVEPSTIYEKLSSDPDKVREIISRLEVQHSSVLEHNRMVWLLEVKDETVLDTLLKTKFFNFTRLGDDNWLMSANLRAVLEYSECESELGDSLLDSIITIMPSVCHLAGRRKT